MRLHKVYHRFSLFHFPKPPLLLSYSPPFLSLNPSVRPPLQFISRSSSTSPAALRAKAMRFRNVVPVNALRTTAPLTAPLVLHHPPPTVKVASGWQTCLPFQRI
ncbi:UNVERIFIED_CONTAM: hypothetical protein Sradi_1426100 [Sesamum radiatum]|uniref:Uncharacterized protein n=1 Tax=Sesamum radiatum TaxID=300843 RepID=A0AAW2USD3_SESRA